MAWSRVIDRGWAGGHLTTGYATIVRMDAQGCLDRAQSDYERAVFFGANDAVESGELALESVEAGLALARGRLAHARF